MRNVFEVNIKLSHLRHYNDGICDIYKSSSPAEISCVNDRNILISRIERRLSELPIKRITATMKWTFSNKVF
jgi:hypothetical protein